MDKKISAVKTCEILCRAFDKYQFPISVLAAILTEILTQEDEQ